MQHGTTLAQPSLINHLTAIKLALQLLERKDPLSRKQQALVQLALNAADAVVEELVNT